MPNIVPIVEGPGDIDAVPVLIRRILYEMYSVYNWNVSLPLRANSLSSFKSRALSFIDYAQRKPDCGAILVLLDLDDGCPRNEALSLAATIQDSYHYSQPIGIVLAHREYESWFLASNTTLGGQYNLQPNLPFPEPVENIRGAKEWLTDHMPPGMIYKETLHQVRMTSIIDLDLVRSRSRSFQRLCNAIYQFVHVNQNQGIVTP